jgi:hypothetical protein
MGCCGQKRAALTSAPPAAAVTRPSPNLPTATSQTPIAGRHATARTQSAPPLSTHYSIVVRYTETSPILVRGPVSGRQYQFSGSKPVQAVDPRDAAALLRTGFFSQS